MPVPGEGSLIVREYEQTDEAAVLELLQTAYGRWPGGIDAVAPAEFFRWKHTAAPFGRSLMLVAERHGDLAGFAAYMPWQLKVDGRPVNARRGVDLAVHPAHRRHGVSQAIRSAGDGLNDGAFFWGNPSPVARQGGLKHGRRAGAAIPIFARFCGRPLQGARRALGADPRAGAQLPVRSPHAGEALADAKRLERLLASIPDPAGRLVTDRHASYLRWRYGQLPAYHAVTAQNGGGFAIFRPRRRGRFWILDICELLAQDGQASLVRELLANVSRAATADLLVCNFPSRSRAVRHGFLQAARGTGLYTQHPVGAGVGDLSDPPAWALSRGDLELL